MSDENLGTVLDILAEQERADLDQAHGEHLVAATEGADKRREAQNRAVLDILHRASQPTEPGDAA
jgi:hypothetical protein